MNRLSNRLYLDGDVVSERLKRALTYKFQDTETVEIVRDDGETVFEDRQVTNIVQNFRVGPNGTIALHCGNLAKIRAMLPEGTTWEDARADVPMYASLKMVHDTKYNQREVIDASLRQGGGLINAPTAYGKTFVGISLAVEADQRVLILCSRTNWLDNWMKDIRNHTNLESVERTSKKKLMGILTPDSSEKNLPGCFCLATPQSFMSKRGKRLRRKLRHSFGMIIFDEAVLLPAAKTSKVYTSFAPLYRFTLSADETRKDGRHKLVYDYVGPVCATGVVPISERSCDVEVVDTGIVVNNNWIRGPFWFGTLCSQLSKRKERNNLLISKVLDDVIAGRKVLVLIDRREQALVLRKMLENELIPTSTADRKADKAAGRPPRKTRMITTEVIMGGDKNSEQKIRAAGEGKYDVVVATDRAIGMNTDMPRLDSCHDLSPTTNEQTIRQRVGRILRPHPDKIWPVRLVVYEDSCSSADSKPGRLLANNMRVRLAFYSKEGYTITGDESTQHAAVKARKKRSIIPRRGYAP